MGCGMSTQAIGPLKTRLRLWRIDQGYTQEEVADLAGISEAFLSRLERGERQIAPKTKVRVARRLGVRVADLFEPEPLEEAS